jgi:histidyl-tRNA synthetase
MPKQISAIRGMNDYYGESSATLDYIVVTAKAVLKQYGYQSISLPIVEKTELFARTIGEITDIVEKEMYTFIDRSGDSLTLRPEGTAGCVRAVIQNGLIHNQQQKLYYTGSMFRYERPQRGRYRQFQQFGVEVFGIATADIDAELIFLTARLWDNLGLDNLQLQINSLGSERTRQKYQVKLVNYLTNVKDQLDEDSKRRLETNPLRILDTKNPDLKEIVAQAPKLIDYLDQDCKEHFELLKGYLDDAGIKYVVNPNLVRGLDYYNKTVFEWVTTELGAQGTVCAGGRYDSLVEQIGGKHVPASGFAMGLERIMALIMDKDILDTEVQSDIFMVLVGDSALRLGMAMIESLRDENKNLKIIMNCGGGSFKSQFKKADKSGATIALILAEDEVNNRTIAIKYLRIKKDQETIAWSELNAKVANIFN